MSDSPPALQLTMPYIRVDYEDLRQDPYFHVCRVLTFLECSCEHNFTTEMPLVKVHDAPKSSYVANWDMVVNTLRGTEYEWMLNS